MKIIDEKGRLFGKINIVDFFIIVLIVILIPVFAVTYQVMQKTPRRVPFKWVKVEAVTFTMPEFAAHFKEGDISRDGYGNVDSKLLKIIKKDDIYATRLKSAIINKNKDARYEHIAPVFLKFELLCTKSAKGEKWYYRRRSLVVSLKDDFVFETDQYSINCYVIKIEE